MEFYFWFQQQHQKKNVNGGVVGNVFKDSQLVLNNLINIILLIIEEYRKIKSLKLLIFIVSYPFAVNCN